MIRYAWIYGLAFLGLKLMEWGFHGPARIIERRLAFNLSRNFLQELIPSNTSPAGKMASGSP